MVRLKKKKTLNSGGIRTLNTKVRSATDEQWDPD